MWNSITITNHQIRNEDIKKIIDGKNSSIVIKNFLKKEDCQKIIEKISTMSIERDSKKFNHIGPFLMNYITKKEEYFDSAEKANEIFEKIFLNIEDPINKIKTTISKFFPNYEISETKENHRNYASCTIRRHTNGKSIPLHKDNVSYEGVEYQVSKINKQLSCVLHLQETEKGGNLSIYNKQWEKKLEKYREVEFGYNPIVKRNTTVDTIKPELGDLVIINPNYLHEVNKIQGNSDRVTLGIFFGIEEKTKKIFSWA
ncbi:MAG: 2OG-Fe(II) oxygenase [Marine Group I thaumarchaeote]|nr:MAG: 2OG-Fe(II) oxygenase [Marine Group I thaumarchaeote]